MFFRFPIFCYGVDFLLIFSTSVASLPQHEHQSRETASSPLVFAHYMLIIQPPNNDYTNDINLAKAAGIDAFAVNYGGDNANFPQLDGFLENFYTTAAKMNFKLFTSIDTTSVTSAPMAANLTQTYVNHPAQLKIDNKALLSSFSNNPPALDWQTDVLDKATSPVLFIAGSLSTTAADVPPQNAPFGQFTWIHPDSTPSSGPVGGQISEASIDADFAAHRTQDKPWMAGIAPWFFRRLAPDQNWLHAQDSFIWAARWENLLKLKPDYIEIVTWNDYGESSYIGPADPRPADVIASDVDYYSSMGHTAFLKMTKIFIKAFKAGQTIVTVDPVDEDIFMMYRTQPALVNGADDTWSLPTNVTYMEDNVYVFSFLANEASATLTSGGNPAIIPAPVGVSTMNVPWTLGAQVLTASRPMADGHNINKKGPDIVGQLKRYNGNVVAL